MVFAGQSAGVQICEAYRGSDPELSEFACACMNRAMGFRVRIPAASQKFVCVCVES